MSVPSSHRRHGNRVGVVARLRPIAEKFLRKFCTTFYLRGLERLRGRPYWWWWWGGKVIELDKNVMRNGFMVTFFSV